MSKVYVFHKIGEPTEDKMTHSIEQILNCDGVITFDGAYKSVYENRNLLAGKEPILFVQGDTVGTEGVCSKEELQELSDMGFVIGWHGWSHRRLTGLPDHVVIRELSAPPQWGVKLYAYPHGDWDGRVASLVAKMGFLRAYSTTQGEEGNEFAVRREYL